MTALHELPYRAADPDLQEPERRYRHRPLVPLSCEEAQCQRLFPDGHPDDVVHLLTMRVERQSIE